MLLQRLVADAADIISEASPPMYNWKPVKWVIDLEADGSLTGCVPQTGDGRRADRGKAMLVPDRTRQGTAPPPILLADTARYSLSLPKGDPQSAVRHTWFIDLLKTASESLPDAGLDAVLAFIQDWDAGAYELPADIEPVDTVTFRVQGRLPVDRTDVRRWWAENWNGSSDNSGSSPAAAAGRGECLVCGEENALIGNYIPLKLKGLPGGQSAGTTLVSINNAAFESLGLRGGHTSRVCRVCGETAMKALNSLVEDDKRHMVMGKLVYLYWVSGESSLELFDLLQNPDANEVGALLKSAFDGRPRSVNTSLFNIVALSAASARAAVRDWHQVDERQLEHALGRWFAGQSMTGSWGQPGEPLGVWALAAAAYRDARTEMADEVPRALIRSAITGASPPHGLLSRVVTRCRLDHDVRSKDRPVSRPRAVLIRTLLASRNSWEDCYMSQLESSEHDAAYLSGRLMAVLEDIQHAALGSIGATVVDKYYGAASATPASVFGKLVGAAQNHLAKIRKDREGLHVVMQRRLTDVLAHLNAFPTTLTLEKQGMFALGYYHERADLRGTRKRQPTDSTVADDLKE